MTEELKNLNQNFLEFSDLKENNLFYIDDDHAYKIITYEPKFIKSKMVIRNLETQEEFFFTVLFTLFLKSSVKK